MSEEADTFVTEIESDGKLKVEDVIENQNFMAFVITIPSDEEE